MKNIIKKQSQLISNIAEIEENLAESYLTKIVGNYELSTEKDVIDLIDAINELSNSRVATFEQIITALFQASDISNSKDISPENLARYASSTAEVTKENGKIIGNFLRIFLSRINSVEEVKEALKEVGIEDFTKTSQVVDSLVSKWSSFSEKKKEEIAIKVSSRFHMARFMILFDNLVKL